MKRPTLKTWRRTFQAGVAAAFILIPYLNRLDIHVLSGNLLSFRAFSLPLADPLAALQVILKSFSLPTDLLIGAALALCLAASLGTVFCSWVCPFGLLSECTQELGRLILPQGYRGRPTGKSGFLWRLGILGLGLLAVIIFSTSPVLNQLSMPGWYSRFFQLWFNQGHLSLAVGFMALVLAGEFVAANRLWCRYLCPQAGLLIFAKLANPWRLQVHFHRERCRCGKASACEAACTLGLHPKEFPPAFETECNNCGDCVVACQKMGRALSFRRGAAHLRPGPGEEAES